MSTSGRGRRSVLPTGVELAAIVRAEHVDLQTLAERYGVSKCTVRARLSHAGYRFDGSPSHQQRPAPLPVTIRPSREWMAAALCAQVDAELFFPDKGGSSREAKSICNGDQAKGIMPCPVREECLEDALRNGERFGIRGGYSERERRVLEQQRRRVA